MTRFAYLWIWQSNKRKLRFKGDVKLEPPCPSILFTLEHHIRHLAQHHFRRRVNERPIQQVSTQYLALGVRHANMQMTTMTRECAGKRQDFKLVLEYHSLILISKANDRSLQATDAAQDIGSLEFLISAVCQQGLSQIGVGLEPHSVNIHFSMLAT